MYIDQYIANHKDEFRFLCQTYKVNTLYALGSSTRLDFNPLASDIDLLVIIDEEDPIERGNLLLGIWAKMETFFNRKVDLLTFDSMRNPIFRKAVDRDKVKIYDRAND